ncbi:MAG: MBL fold metallo-hydrolase [Planctomycetaceae bacterium]|nr:MBL fold metallo-hydrolase [Planctomycetaceae bacterium]
MQKPELVLETVISDRFAENAYLAHLEGRDDCLVVDPGLDVDRIVNRLTERRLTPAAILNTHGHADHIGGNAGLKKIWPNCPLIIGADDADKLADASLNLSQQYGIPIASPAADRLVGNGEICSAAGFDLEVLETPGHSLGHVVFVWKAIPHVIFGGDVLFKGSIGRTDLPDGDFATLRDVIQTRLFQLPDDTIVFPGHGDPTTIGAEKKHNPFVGEPSGFSDNSSTANDLLS